MISTTRNGKDTLIGKNTTLGLFDTEVLYWDVKAKKVAQIEELDCWAFTLDAPKKILALAKPELDRRAQAKLDQEAKRLVEKEAREQAKKEKEEKELAEYQRQREEEQKKYDDERAKREAAAQEAQTEAQQPIVQAKAEPDKIEKNSQVEIVAGRKFRIGSVGKVFWIGADRFRAGCLRVGIEFANSGIKDFTAIEDCKLVK